MVEPNRITDDIGTKSVTVVYTHHRVIDQRQLICQHPLQLEVDDI